MADLKVHFQLIILFLIETLCGLRRIFYLSDIFYTHIADP